MNSPRFPLSAKMMLAALLNLALLAGALAVFLALDLDAATEALLTSPASDRLRAIAPEFLRDLEKVDRSSWDTVLENLGQRLGARAYLADPMGERIAGPHDPIPREVRERMDPNRGRGKQRSRPSPEKAPTEKSGAEKSGRDKMKDLMLSAPPPAFVVRTSNPSRIWAVARIPLGPPGEPGSMPAILVIEAASMFNRALFFDYRILIGALLAAAGISFLCWLPLVRGMTRTVQQMDHATSKIAEGRFDVHVNTRRQDELGHLGEQINRMSRRLEVLWAGQKRFLGDVAHELSAPISRVRMALGILTERAKPDQEAYLADLQEEVEQMSALVHELLQFSKAGLRTQPVELAAIELGPAIQRVVDRETAAGGTVQVIAEPGLLAMTEENHFQRSLGNVIRNAIRYAGDAGPVQVIARREQDHAEIEVADFGPGIPEDSIDRIFEPFYRPEAARTRGTGGTGLGLAIVKTAVEACQGSVRCKNRQPHGLEVILSFRLAS